MAASIMSTLPSMFTSPGGTIRILGADNVLSPVTISLLTMGMLAEMTYSPGGTGEPFQAIVSFIDWPGPRLMYWTAMLVLVLFLAVMKRLRLSGKVPRSATVTFIVTMWPSLRSTGPTLRLVTATLWKGWGAVAE